MSGNDLVSRLDERKVRVVRHHCFRERDELHAAHQLLERFSLVDVPDARAADVAKNLKWKAEVAKA